MGNERDDADGHLRARSGRVGRRLGLGRCGSDPPERRSCGLSLTLTGLGERVHLAHPDIDLDVHVQDVVHAIEYEDLAEVILVGWSHGAMVVTAAAHRIPERLRRTVVMDTFLVPEDGQSAYDIAPSFRHEDEPLLLAGNGWQIPPPPASALEASIPDADRRASYVRRMTPMPVKVQRQPARLGHPLADALPRTLVRCTQMASWSDNPLHVEFVERITADPRWDIVDLDGRHMAPFAQPNVTAEVLHQLVVRDA